MAISVRCPECGEKLTLKESARGKQVRCRNCGERVPVRSSTASRVRPNRGGRKRKKSKSSWKLPVFIGTGVVGLVLVIGVI